MFSDSLRSNRLKNVGHEGEGAEEDYVMGLYKEWKGH